MRLFFKRLSVVGLVIGAILIIAGCNAPEEVTEVKNDQPLISEIKNDKPLPLSEVVGGNDEALELAADSAVINQPDEFLIYVDRQKQRDRKERESTILISLDDLEAALADL